MTGPMHVIIISLLSDNIGQQKRNWLRNNLGQKDFRALKMQVMLCRAIIVSQMILKTITRCF